MFLNPFDTAGFLIKGLIVGIIASAPMGPVGVLTVQRTLNKGRWYGFVTGMGAALSDLLYALFTALGMSVALEFVERPNAVLYLKLLGSVMLFLFGLWTYNATPQVRRPSRNRGTLAHNMLTGLLVTLGNPLIILLFVALFARFDFVEAHFRWENVFGFVGIACGAFLWWFCLTGAIDRLRTRFQMKNIVRLNRAIGLVVMVASVVGFFYTIIYK